MGDKKGIKMASEKNSESKLVEVDFARKFQEAVVSSSVICFKEDALKSKIMSASPDQLLVVHSTINSPKEILSVDEYNEEFLLNAL